MFLYKDELVRDSHPYTSILREIMPFRRPGQSADRLIVASCTMGLFALMSLPVHAQVDNAMLAPPATQRMTSNPASPPGEIVFDAATDDFRKVNRSFKDGQTVKLRLVNINMFREKYTLQLEGEDTYNLPLPAALGPLISRSGAALATLPEGTGVSELTSAPILPNDKRGNPLPAPLAQLYAEYHRNLDAYYTALAQPEKTFQARLAGDMRAVLINAPTNRDIKIRLIDTVLAAAPPTPGNPGDPSPVPIQLTAEEQQALRNYSSALSTGGEFFDEKGYVDANLGQRIPAIARKFPGGPEESARALNTAHQSLVNAAVQWRLGYNKWRLLQASSPDVKDLLLRFQNTTSTLMPSTNEATLRNYGVLDERDSGEGALVGATQYQSELLAFFTLRQLRTTLQSMTPPADPNAVTRLTAAINELNRLIDTAQPSYKAAYASAIAPGGVVAQGVATDQLNSLRTRSETAAAAEFLPVLNSAAEEADRAIRQSTRFTDAINEERVTALSRAKQGLSDAGSIFVIALNPDVLPVSLAKNFRVARADSVRATVKVEQIAAPLDLPKAADVKTVSFQGPSDNPTLTKTYTAQASVTNRIVIDYSTGLISTNLKQRNWVIKGGTVQPGVGEKHNLGLGAMAHLYMTSERVVTPALSLGIAGGDNTRLLGGVSLVARLRQARLHFSYGAAWGKVNALNGQEVGDTATAVNATQVQKQGVFRGVTFGLNF
ncbi:MAG: hypothetical protein JWN98_2454 [Abditibacteriota bacterium]|nr:hypothetical protein [Abditibacteriota bacterium]